MTPPDKTDMFILGGMLAWAVSFLLWAFGGR